MKTAIVYYSLEGNTKYTADKIADLLKESCEVDVLRFEPEQSYPDKGFKKFFHIFIKQIPVPIIKQNTKILRHHF